jgi:hypothetical protein
MEPFSNSLQDSSNLILLILNSILVIITGIYAYLTWRMVREMKVARENQSDSYLIASPVSMGTIHAQIQLENAGPGPALDIELSISLDPPLQTTERKWRHPVMHVNQKEHFLIPQKGGGSLDSLQQLGERHTNLNIELRWKNIFGKQKSSSAKYNLRELAEGWYNAGNLIKPDDLPEQMEKVAKSLYSIHKDIEEINRDRRLKPIIENMHKAEVKKTNTSRKKKATK